MRHKRRKWAKNISQTTLFFLKIKYNALSKVLNYEFHLVIDVSFICVVIYKMPPSKRLAGKNMYSMLDFTYIAIYIFEGCKNNHGCSWC